MADHPSRSVRNVVDMSVGSSESSFSIFVGPERRQFILLGQVLNMKSIGLDLLVLRCAVSPPEQLELPGALVEYRLDIVDPEAFNLLAQCLYGMDLPRVPLAWPRRTKLSLKDGCLSEVPHPAQLQTSGALEPLVEKENATGSDQNRFLHIVFHEPYRKFSAEEIRISDKCRLRHLAALKKSSMVNPKGASEGHIQQSAVVKTEDSGKPVDAGASIEEENERIQTGLLKLMLVAEIAGWDQCFTDAMDNYRHGEIQMKRNSLNLDHIDLAYSTIASAHHMPDHSPTLNFIADYAYSKGTEHGLLTVYLGLFTKFPRFLSDIQLREQGTH
ncbi:nuclear protein 96-domain-containing protein [Apiospora marii]|uniref:Nuclear protein 96-domain-containing protein n=1 Tax=Apiospora marii TaxID=335849 RepID=A0ABR1S8R2_9PEZI